MNERWKFFTNVVIGDKCSVWQRENLCSLLSRYYTWLDLCQVCNIFLYYMASIRFDESCNLIGQFEVRILP